MVLSLPFILAFIGASVVLIIGIIIFTEVTDAMALTLPVQPSGGGGAVTNAEWQFREQRWNNVNPAECTIEGGSQSTPIFAPHLDVDNADVGTRQGFCHVFKVFNATDIINKQLTVSWAGTHTGTNTNHKITVYDGSYLRSNNTDFAVNTGDGFNPSKGAYILHQLTQNTGTFATTNDIIDLTLVGATQPQVTVKIGIVDGSTGQGLLMDLVNVTISDVGFWKWAGGGAPFSYTLESDGLGNAYGTFFTVFTDLVPVPTPLTAGEVQQVETFNSALAIGFTVLGILPVALFFALFAIFGSLMGGRSGS